MQANDFSPYALKDLYQAIDLIDRKIAHYSTIETFNSLETRDADLKKFSSKRSALVKSALALTNLGVRCDPQFLPRSFALPVQDEAGAVAAPVLAEGRKRKTTARPRQKRS